MRKEPVRRAICASLSLALATGPQLAQAKETIRCESHGMRYQYCSVETKNHVKFLQKHSFWDCNEGRSWGFDQHGVWVDHGCKADFEVGQDKDKRIQKGVVIGAAVLGLAALAALAARKPQAADNAEDSGPSGHGQQEAPSWAIGNFAGQDDLERTRVELHISPGGVVSGRASGHSFTGQLQGAHLQAGRHGFRIEKHGNGFMARDEQNSAHQVWFQRNGSDEPGGY